MIRFGVERRLSSLLAVGCASFATLAGSATVINVPADQPTIQAGIDAAVDGDTVLVAPGTYNEAINLQGKAITLQSSGGSSVTTIDAAGLDTTAMMIPFSNGGGQLVIEGFTVTGGAGTKNGDFSRIAGGVNVLGGDTLMQDCRIVGNSACDAQGTAGGLHVAGAALLTMRNCLISGNSACGVSGLTGGAAGGGFFAVNATLVLIACAITDNHVIGTGLSGGNATGGGMLALGTFVLIGCVIDGNTATASTSGSGAAIDTGSSSSFTLVNCRVTNNQASPSILSPGISRQGGGGGAGSLTLTNCTVANNTINGTPAPGTAGGVHNASKAAVTILNSIMVANSGLQIGGPSSTTAQFSCVEGGFPGDGNIDANPQFIDAANGDYRLATGSPCIDVGNLDDLPADAFDLDDDGDRAERIPVDLDELRRVVNGFVDMGAHEWQHECVADISPSSPGVAGDGAVDVNDLLTVIKSWGECDGCVADIDGDGDGDVDDLLAIIKAWGPCS